MSPTGMRLRQSKFTPPSENSISATKKYPEPSEETLNAKRFFTWPRIRASRRHAAKFYQAAASWDFESFARAARLAMRVMKNATARAMIMHNANNSPLPSLAMPGASTEGT